MVTVKSARQVDLTGQVVAESRGYTFYGGIGGQVDFIRGAAMSRGGKPIIALPSTAKGGTLSSIVPALDEGAGVVTSRGDVHYVVTEWGVAYLHGKTIRERALALINIAHPDYRRDLLGFLKERQYVYADEKIWDRAANPYPSEWETVEQFGDDELFVRPLRASDERLLQDFFYSHEESTIYYRYFTVKKQLGHKEAAHLCCVDYAERMALGVFTQTGPAERMVAVGRYDLNGRTNFAESAVVVGEQWRRRGIATYLLARLGAYARTKGIAGFTSEILADNHAMAGLHRKLGNTLNWHAEAHVHTTRRRFDAPRRARTSARMAAVQPPPDWKE